METTLSDDFWALRAHKPDRQTLSAYSRLVREFGPEKVVIVADEVSSPPQTWPEHVRVLSITPASLEELGITTAIPDSGWRCGDYALATVFQGIPAATRVWLIEPDVGFSRLTPREFAGYFDSSDADLVISFLAKMGPSGFWADTLRSRGFEGEEWHSFFPILRTTRAASDAAVKLRREVQAHPSEKMHPNDETVLASAVMAAGLKAERMEDYLPWGFKRMSPGRRLPLWLLRTLYPGPQIFHPVGTPDVLPRRTQDFVRSIRG